MRVAVGRYPAGGATLELLARTMVGFHTGSAQTPAVGEEYSAPERVLAHGIRSTIESPYEEDGAIPKSSNEDSN